MTAQGPEFMLDWVVVGGGPHGVHLANQLLEAGVEHAKLRIVDPAPRLMNTWHRCTTNTGMTHLRSPGVHHLDIDPFSLLRFASSERQRKQDAKKPFARPYNRPAIHLFAEHCNQLIKEYELAVSHLQDEVTAAHLDCNEVRLDLGHGESLHTQRVLLAVGASDQPRWPSWARDLPSGSVRHIFESGFELIPEAWPKRVAVVGAGISGAQVALRLAGPEREVTLISRHPLRKHQFDSEPGWVGPKYMQHFSKVSDPEVRREIIGKARHSGSVSPDIHRRLHGAMENGRVRFVQGEVERALDGESIQLRVGTTAVRVDAVLLATGFEPSRPGGKLVDDLIDAQSLPCSTCGFPLLDRHLRWHPRIFVTGPLAELEVGPVSRNLIGARRAAERIVPVALDAL